MLSGGEYASENAARELVAKLDDPEGLQERIDSGTCTSEDVAWLVEALALLNTDNDRMAEAMRVLALAYAEERMRRHEVEKRLAHRRNLDGDE